MTSPGVVREAHPMLSKSIQSIVGIFVGFAIGGVLGLVATPPAPAPSIPSGGVIAAVDRQAEPVAVTLTIVLGPTTTRGPRDDAVLPLMPVFQEPAPADPSPTPKAAEATSGRSAGSTPVRKDPPKPKAAPAVPRSTPPPQPAVEPPAPVVEPPPPTPEPKAERAKGPKPRPDKPPRPPRPPK